MPSGLQGRCPSEPPAGPLPCTPPLRLRGAELPRRRPRPRPELEKHLGAGPAGPAARRRPAARGTTRGRAGSTSPLTTTGRVALRSGPRIPSHYVLGAVPFLGRRILVRPEETGDGGVMVPLERSGRKCSRRSRSQSPPPLRGQRPRRAHRAAAVEDHRRKQAVHAFAGLGAQVRVRQRRRGRAGQRTDRGSAAHRRRLRVGARAAPAAAPAALPLATGGRTAPAAGARAAAARQRRTATARQRLGRRGPA